jgi:hypothetical protein
LLPLTAAVGCRKMKLYDNSVVQFVSTTAALQSVNNGEAWTPARVATRQQVRTCNAAALGFTSSFQGGCLVSPC